MTHSNFNYNSDANKPAKPMAKKRSFGDVASSDNYQRFLEYLENTGNTRSFRKQIMENKFIDPTIGEKRIIH
ncbi:hypothetical protein A3J44_05500 [candidate division WOR-1 bacterium RIFCSPHIGHO2_02_FULL_45_12]|nr:MAG: hypothetical protein A3J44_05500 [candidate division WOR-1 bacterium RIFCSPHIGHO2_02_FULL_45_12]